MRPNTPNAPPAPLSLRDPLSAVSGGVNNFPAGLTIIGWGNEFKSPSAQHFNIGVQKQIGNAVPIPLGKAIGRQLQKAFSGRLEAPGESEASRAA